MRNPVVRRKPDLPFEAKYSIPERTATITIKIHVENTVFVIYDKYPLSANACGGTDRICGASWASIFVRIIDENFELQGMCFFR